MTVLIVSIVFLAVFGIVLCYVCRRYETRIKKEFRRAQKSDQLKTLFMSNISHSLRTPLNAVSSYSKLMLEDPDSSAQVKEMAAHINNDSEQMLKFITLLLKLSNFEGSISPFTHLEVNLAELMASYQREAQHYVKPETMIRIKTDLSPHCKAKLDANGMHMLMKHLLTNAAVNVTQGDITISYTKERRGLRVTISYMGVGQAELIGEDIYSFLQKEDTLMHVKDSSVLSLSICKAIVDFLDGDFDMEAENGLKTVASFWFPCHMSNCYRKNNK